MSYDDRSLVRSVQQPFTEFFHAIFSFEDRLETFFILNNQKIGNVTTILLSGFNIIKQVLLTFFILPLVFLCVVITVLNSSTANSSNSSPDRLRLCFLVALFLSFSFLSNHLEV